MALGLLVAALLPLVAGICILVRASTLSRVACGLFLAGGLAIGADVLSGAYWLWLFLVAAVCVVAASLGAFVALRRAIATSDGKSALVSLVAGSALVWGIALLQAAIRSIR